MCIGPFFIRCGLPTGVGCRKIFGQDRASYWACQCVLAFILVWNLLAVPASFDGPSGSAVDNVGAKGAIVR